MAEGFGPRGSDDYRFWWNRLLAAVGLAYAAGDRTTHIMPNTRTWSERELVPLSSEQRAEVWRGICRAVNFDELRKAGGVPQDWLKDKE